MDDLITISKRDATETLLALTGHKTVRDLAEHVAEHELEEFYDGGVLDAIDAISDVKSAYPQDLAEKIAMIVNNGKDMRAILRNSGAGWKSRLLEHIEARDDAMYTKGGIIDLIKNFK